MGLEPENQDIVRLLTKLKNAEAQYPEHMLVARRHVFLKQLMEVGMGISTGAGIEHTAKNTSGTSISGATSTLVETALVVAIIVETSAVAYFYREQLADFFQTIAAEPRVQEVISPPVVPTSAELQGVAPSPAITPTLPSATLSTSPSPLEVVSSVTLTPMPGLAGDNHTNSANNINGTAEFVQPDSTSAPNVNNENDDQGNHYGQTPKPERTKESNGNSDPSSGNNDAPPQEDDTQENNDQPSNGNDDKPPKDEPKPTKDK